MRYTCSDIHRPAGWRGRVLQPKSVIFLYVAHLVIYDSRWATLQRLLLSWSPPSCWSLKPQLQNPAGRRYLRPGDIHRPAAPEPSPTTINSELESTPPPDRQPQNPLHRRSSAGWRHTRTCGWMRLAAATAFPSKMTRRRCCIAAGRRGSPFQDFEGFFV